MGGTNDPSNLIKVNIPLHALLHKLLWEKHGHWQDEIAWKAISGQIPNAKINNEIRKKRMIGNQLWKDRRHKEESKQKMGPKRGTKFTKKHKQKLSEARRNRVTKDSTREKLSQPRYNKRLKYEITFPNGTIEKVNGLSDFCKQHNLTESNLRKTLNGERMHHRNYKAKRVN